MACDQPGAITQQQQQQQQQQTPAQQQQQCLSSGSGALPMQVSPSPTPAQSLLQHPPPLDVPGSSSLADLQQSPGPSSRRGEDADAVAQALLRLGVLFQFEVYLYAHESLRGESNVWTEALRSLMGSGSSSTLCMQVREPPGWLARLAGLVCLSGGSIVAGTYSASFALAMPVDHPSPTLKRTHTCALVWH
jgi:hypothetical protein